MAALAVFSMGFAASAANWNDSFGVGDGAGNGYFSASGVNLAVIASVRSNSLYVVLGGRSALGSPRINAGVFIKPDLTGCLLDWWTSTNTWTCASNQPAGTNIIWLTTTNLGLATNDVLVLEQQDGTEQVLILSGNATDLAGLVYTNAAGYNGVKVFTTPTNTIAAGDTIHKMALKQQLLPFGLQNVTNDVAAPWGQWWGVSTRAFPLVYYGTVGKPSVLMLNYSNAAGLFVGGDFKRREQ